MIGQLRKFFLLRLLPWRGRYELLHTRPRQCRAFHDTASRAATLSPIDDDVDSAVDYAGELSFEVVHVDAVLAEDADIAFWYFVTEERTGVLRVCRIDDVRENDIEYAEKMISSDLVGGI